MERMSPYQIDRMEKERFSNPGRLSRSVDHTGSDISVSVGGRRVDSTVEICHPREIRDLFESFLENDAVLFERYLPIGCSSLTQDVWVVDVTSGRVAAIPHDTVPADWWEETWKTPGDWLTTTSLLR